MAKAELYALRCIEAIMLLPCRLLDYRGIFPLYGAHNKEKTFTIKANPPRGGGAKPRACGSRQPSYRQEVITIAICPRTILIYPS
jgi:hypothetical protein